MPNQSKLLESNPQLAPQRPVEDSPEQTQTIHLDTRNLYRTSKVPNSLQIALGEAYSAAADLSLNSLDLEALCVTDELRFELNPSRFSFLHSINFAGVDHCLDLTQDFGGVAHYLASQCRLVDAVRTDIDAARLTSERCHSALNLNLICANLNSLKLPKQHYDLIVIGEAEGLQLSRDERNTLLARLRDSLSSMV